MAKKIFVGRGGKAKVFRTKRGFLKWAVTTQEGWKFLKVLLVWWPYLRIVRMMAAIFPSKPPQDHRIG